MQHFRFYLIVKTLTDTSQHLNFMHLSPSLLVKQSILFDNSSQIVDLYFSKWRAALITSVPSSRKIYETVAIMIGIVQ